MVSVPIAFRSGSPRYSFTGNSRLLNAYAEQQGSDGKAPMVVLPCPGMVQCASVTDTPNRGLIYLDDLDVAYSVHSSGVYKIALSTSSPFALTATRIGIIPGADQVQISRNQADPAQISIHSTAGEYYVEADVVKKVTDVDLPPTVTQDYSSGYTIYGIADGRFFWSGLNQCQTIDSLNFATAEQYADKLVRIKADGSDIFIFSRTSLEPWRFVGNIDLPFQLISGSVSKKGIVAPNAVISNDNSLEYAGEDNIFYRLNGYAPTRISDHGIERMLEADPERESLSGFSYTFQGHSMSHWNGSNFAVTRDAATNVWHERQSTGLDFWRARNAIRAWGKTIVGDALTGNLYYLDSDTYDEGGTTMLWGMDTPIIHVFPNGGIVDALYIDVATGVGKTLATDQGFDPTLMLDWSIDGGNSFIGNRQLKIGKRGDRVRIVTRRIGRFGDKGIMFRLRISDPVIRSIVELDAAIRPIRK